jgi:hypothetical protein
VAASFALCCDVMFPAAMRTVASRQIAGWISSAAFLFTNLLYCGEIVDKHVWN